MHLNYPQKSNGMYCLKRTDMDDIATGVLRENMPYVLESAQPVEIEYLAQECYYLSIEEQRISIDGDVLGLITFEKTEIYVLDDLLCPFGIEADEATMFIDKALFSKEKEKRLNFTIGHETAHWLLHRSFHSPTKQQFQYRTQRMLNKYIACRSENIERSKKRNLITDIDWEEWQADCLSASLLMPIQVFGLAVHDAFRKIGFRGKCIVKDTNNGYCDREEYEVKKCLSSLFNVSIKAIEIRMIQLGYIRENSSYIC